MTKPHLTDFGTPGIGVVPYGLHMCHFYSSRQELVEGLVPFFLAGLASNELCIWIAASPFPADEVRLEAGNHPTLKKALESGQLLLVDAAEWYGDIAKLDIEEAIQRVLDVEQRALADGFSGVRITGNASFVPADQWHRFMHYEARIQQRIRNHRIVACCSYPRKDSQPIEMMEALHHHDGAMDRAGAHWEVFFTPQAGAPPRSLSE